MKVAVFGRLFSCYSVPMRLVSLLGILGLVSVLALLQLIALEEFLYWQFWWFDLVMHFIGGLIIGGIALFITSYILSDPKYTFPFFLFVLVVVGVGWELLELSTGMFREDNYTLDTSIDLLMDTLGAVVVYGTVRHGKRT